MAANSISSLRMQTSSQPREIGGQRDFVRGMAFYHSPGTALRFKQGQEDIVLYNILV